MALTLTTTNYPFRDRLNDVLVRRVTYTGPSSYATGGDVIDNDVDFGWGQVHTLAGIAHNGSGTFRLLVLDRTNQTILWVVPNTGAEVANGTDLSTFTAELFVTGR